jgi:hypothetical protein
MNENLNRAIKIIEGLTKFYMENKNWVQQSEAARAFVREVKAGEVDEKIFESDEV